MESSVCWNDIGYKLNKSILTPIPDLLLNPDSYSQVYSLLVNQQFFPAIPCLTFYAGMLMFVWRNHKRFEISGHMPLLNSKYFIPGQVLLIWIFLNNGLTIWLTLQKVLYCFVWCSFSQTSKPIQILPSELWWFPSETEPLELEKTFSVGAYLWQPEYISWMIAEIVAGIFVFAINIPSFKTKDKIIEIPKEQEESLDQKDEVDVCDSANDEQLTELYQLRCRKGRPNKPYSSCPAEVPTKKNNSDTEIQ